MNWRRKSWRFPNFYTSMQQFNEFQETLNLPNSSNYKFNWKEGTWDFGNFVYLCIFSVKSIVYGKSINWHQGFYLIFFHFSTSLPWLGTKAKQNEKLRSPPCQSKLKNVKKSPVFLVILVFYFFIKNILMKPTTVDSLKVRILTF